MTSLIILLKELSTVSKAKLIDSEHDKKTVETSDFLKMIIDWCIYQCLNTDSRKNDLKQRLPTTTTGGHYFYNPEVIRQNELDTQYSFHKVKNPLEFAYTEIFSYYSNKYQKKNINDFELLTETLQRLNIRGYIAFVKDFHLPIDKQSVIEVWKKTSVNNQYLQYDDFRSSIQKLAIGSIKFQKEQIMRKINTVKQAQQAKQNQETKKESLNLPTQYLVHEGKTMQQLQDELSSYEAEVHQLQSVEADEALKTLLDKYIEYQYPAKYRRNMPGYQETPNLLTVNTNLTKKILFVRSINKELSLSGSTEATLMHSQKQQSTKQTTNLKEQRDSIIRLQPQIKIQAEDINFKKQEINQRYILREIHQAKRQERTQETSDQKSDISIPFKKINKDDFDRNNSPSPQLIKKLTFQDIMAMHNSAFKQEVNKEDEYNTKRNRANTQDDNLIAKFKKNKRTKVLPQQLQNLIKSREELDEHIAVALQDEPIFYQANGHRQGRNFVNHSHPTTPDQNQRQKLFTVDHDNLSKQIQNQSNENGLRRNFQVTKKLNIQSQPKLEVQDPKVMPQFQRLGYPESKLPINLRKQSLPIQSFQSEISPRLQEVRNISQQPISKLDQLNTRDVTLEKEKQKMLKRANEIQIQQEGKMKDQIQQIQAINFQKRQL